MESEDERRPLLSARARHSNSYRFRKWCLRIPSELAITGIIIGIFIIIVSMLIIFQYLYATTLTKWDQVTEVSLLGSTQLNALGNSSATEKDRQTSERKGKDEDKNVNRRKESAPTTSEVGSLRHQCTLASRIGNDIKSVWLRLHSSFFYLSVQGSPTAVSGLLS
ncbi:uncharacterized protein LOC129228061 [Uloborus diversus]|uniref:uncharacterized protein LOC129228061 n=1 Tax=Uloborus diversus TaxID=327109 RepID=UPI00240A00C3|nr:uncharacterized protein LOC129228061 [Uloborus diversus]